MKVVIRNDIVNLAKYLVPALLCLFATMVLAAQVTYKIGHYGFQVPKENVVDLSPWHWIKSIGGLDKNTGSFMFQLSGSLVGAEVNEYMARIDNLDKPVVGALYLINEVERNRMNDPSSLADLWHARNGYEDREVVFDEESGYYFVFEKKGYRGIFQVFSKAPESDLPKEKQDFFVTSCSGLNSEEIHRATCNIKVLYKPDLMLSYSLSFKNLKAHHQVEALLRQTLSEWEI